MKKTTMPGMPEVEVVEIKTSAPVNVLADPAPAKKPAAKRTRKTAAKTAEEKKPAAKRGRKPKAATAAAKKAEGPKKPTALIIMDGFGHREETKGNAIEAAKKPNLDKIFAENPLTYIGASGLDVGLPDGQMGNSEVGHTNIGAGRIVYQELTRITKAIQDGDFFENPALMSAINQCKWFDSTLHIFGLLSDGGVHSHIDHMFALLELARRNGLRKVCFHCFMDGRDTPPQSGIEYIDRLQAKIDAVEVGCIATVSGRYYAMDRDNRWDRVQKAYNAIALGEGEHAATAHEAMEQSYANGVTDEFVVPVIVTEGATVKDDDAIIFANFRPDRAREITRAFVDPEFTGFERVQPKIHYVCMTQYDATIPGVEIAFKPQSLKNTFGEYISDLGMTQLRIAETEKYAHVTFFFNGGVEKEYPGEDRALIPSPKVATYDLQPEMSEPAVTEECVKRILSGKYDVVILNFANCDMVGHTGVFEAAVKAIEATDDGVGKVVDAILKMGGQCLITADHGNVDQMLDADGVTPFTAHSTNPVPLVMVGHTGVFEAAVKAIEATDDGVGKVVDAILKMGGQCLITADHGNVDQMLDADGVTPFTAHSTNPVPLVMVGHEGKLAEGGVLADLAPTMLDMMGLKQPEEMTGHSLLVK